jgi:uncharacterized protein with PQ loop repeat
VRLFFVRRGWQIGLLLILLIAASLRLASYDFGLPFVEPDDESNYYLAGQEWRDLFDNGGYYNGVPPGYIALQTALQPILENLGARDLASTTQAMRLLAVVVNLATLVWIALAARRMAGDLAGLIAGLVWGIAPLVLENGVYALPDPFVYCFVALSLWLAIEALLVPERRGWSVGSITAALLAVLMKYPALPALIPGLLVGLWTLRQHRTQGVRLLAVQIILIATVGLWLVFIYGVDFNNLQREGATVRNQGLSNMLDPTRVLNNLYYAIFPLLPAAWLGIGVLSVIAYRMARRVNLGSVVLCLAILVTIPWLAASFSQVEPTKIRYVLPATVAACVLFGAAVGQIVFAIPRRWLVPAGVVAAAVGLLIVLPQFRASLALVQSRRLPESRVELRRWFDTNLEPGTVIVDRDNHLTFNPIWGGIPHRTWVDWWETSTITENTLAEWRERDMSYAAIPRGQVDELRQSDEGRAYLDSLLHLRDFYTPPAARGPEMSFYRLWRMDVERDVHFGEAITLLGYDLSAVQAQPGDSLTFRFYWQAAQTPTDNYSLFIHLVPRDADDVLAQADGSPAVPERPTLTWDDPGETLISPSFTVNLPETLSPGRYRIFIGLYNYATGQRLPVDSGADALLLTDIRITQQ